MRGTLPIEHKETRKHTSSSTTVQGTRERNLHPTPSTCTQTLCSSCAPSHETRTSHYPSNMHTRKHTSANMNGTSTQLGRSAAAAVMVCTHVLEPALAHACLHTAGPRSLLCRAASTAQLSHMIHPYMIDTQTHDDRYTNSWT